MSGFTQSDVDHYDEMLTKHDPHSPYFDGPFTDSPGEEEVTHSNRSCRDATDYGEGCAIQKCTCTCHDGEEDAGA